MNEMIERVSEAIGAVFSAEHDDIVAAALSGNAPSSLFDALLAKCARAAIEAMREPTKEMIIDGLFGIQTNMDSTRDSNSSWDFAVEGTAYHCWVEMIDAALKNDTPKP